jgi:hypothetical protein
MTIAVRVPDSSVRPMNDDFRLLVLSYRSGRPDGFSLRIVHGGDPFVALSSNCPPVLVWDYVLLLTHV